jgi:hypothetical protein
MSGNFIEKADKFIETYRSLLIALAIAIGLFNAFQNYQSKQVKWVDGWTCSYWDAQRNDYQGLIEDKLRNPDAIGNLDAYTKMRDQAAEKFNRGCLPESAYLIKD